MLRDLPKEFTYQEDRRFILRGRFTPCSEGTREERSAACVKRTVNLPLRRIDGACRAAIGLRSRHLIASMICMPIVNTISASIKPASMRKARSSVSSLRIRSITSENEGGKDMLSAPAFHQFAVVVFKGWESVADGTRTADCTGIAPAGTLNEIESTVCVLNCCPLVIVAE